MENAAGRVRWGNGGTVGNGASCEGVAFAFQSSTIAVGATVASRVAPSDSFEVSVVSPESQIVGTNSTGTNDVASTGDLVVLPRVDGSSYTLRETAGPGTNLTAYDVSWACTRNGVADPSLTASGVDSITVSPADGDAISCIVTNAVDQTPGTTTAPTSAPSSTTTTPSAVVPVVTPQFTG